MRENEGDTRQKGEEWRRERRAVPSSSSQAARLLFRTNRITASPVQTAGMVQSNIQHCARRIICELDTGDICVAEEAAHKDREAYAPVLLHKMRWTPACSLVAGPANVTNVLRDCAAGEQTETQFHIELTTIFCVQYLFNLKPWFCWLLGRP